MGVETLHPSFTLRAPYSFNPQSPKRRQNFRFDTDVK